MVAEPSAAPAALPGLLRLIRPRDWVKNGLVAAPLLFSGRLFDAAAVERVVLAALALCLAASAGYVLNDLRDAASDRLHPTKRMRPLAAGVVSLPAARGLAVGLAATSIALGAILGSAFLLALVSYLVLAALYTLWLKHLVILDVLTIGAFYVIRVVAGSLAAQVPASDWLIIATGLLAIFIGLCKRRHELLLMKADAERHRGVLAQYTERFLDPAISLTTSTTLITYLLYALSDETVAKFGSRGMLWGGPFVFYGLLRYLHLVYSLDEGGSPSELVTTDPGVLAAVAGFAAVAALVVYL